MRLQCYAILQCHAIVLQRNAMETCCSFSLCVRLGCNSIRQCCSERDAVVYLRTVAMHASPGLGPRSGRTSDTFDHIRILDIEHTHTHEHTQKRVHVHIHTAQSETLSSLTAESIYTCIQSYCSTHSLRKHHHREHC